MIYSIHVKKGGDKMNICVEAAETSNRFEKNNTELKKNYLLHNVNTINIIMSRAPGYCGSFGTGYPFYVLDSNLEGNLPLIDEQIRYNNELLYSAKKLSSQWECASCLSTKGTLMPDLKQICKPCPQVCDDLKPRKVVNRLPDVDMWMICLDTEVENAKDFLSTMFDAFDMHTSDVDPVKTIHEVSEITTDLEHGNMPSKLLPLDVHIIEYSKVSKLLDEVPFTLQMATENNTQPYLPIHPLSLRKTWQYDDVAYNFVLDFLLSMTPFFWDSTLTKKLDFSRNIISQTFSVKNLSDILHSVAPESVERRFETPQLQKTYERRVESWKK